MKACFLFLFSFLISFNSYSIENIKWGSYSKSEELNIKNLFKILKRSRTGNDLLAKAKEKASATGRTLMDIVSSGNNSMTDTTLIRRFSKSNPGKTVYELRSKIVLNKDLPLSDAILDLSHELTHFVDREDFNPYSTHFSLDEFITSTIEGRGGEVEAYLKECKVAEELFSKEMKRRYQCREIQDSKTGGLVRKKAVDKFYRVGSYFKMLKKQLQHKESLNTLQKITEGEAVFVSSVYGMPYPVAAMAEYLSVLTKVCENDMKRLSMLASSGRSPASEKEKSSLWRDYNKRCFGVNQVSQTKR